MKNPTPNVFIGMPSLLYQEETFSKQWPIVKNLPPLESQVKRSYNSEEWVNDIPLLKVPELEKPVQIKKKRIRIKKSKKIQKCPHLDRKHYAKQMCNVCYHSKARQVKATKCEHKDNMMYAKGMCLRCYQKTYKKQKRMIKKLKKQMEI